MSKRIAINGFGRIGKAFLRAIMDNEKAKKEFCIAAINLGPSSPDHLAAFFKYDSTLSTFPGSVRYENKKLFVEDKEISILTEPNPANLPWKKLDIDWVIEASGLFTSKKKAGAHFQAGAKKVLITAPAKEEDVTIIPGVNDDQYDKEKHKLISLGSCTTNCFAPIIKVLKENFSLEKGQMTTIHSYTNNQVLLDSEHHDPRRGRAAAVNIVPTSTGASKVMTKIYPDLEGQLFGTALRVPVPIVSIVDFSFVTKKPVSKESINDAFKSASENELKNILAYSTEPTVSSDHICSPYSCIIDGLLTKGSGTMGQVFGWYDNEYGYSSRLIDFLLHN